MKRRKGQNVKARDQVQKCSSYDLQTMMEGFLMEQSCRGNSKATVVYYKANISKFIEYLEDQGLETDTSSITKEQLKKYILHLKTSKKWSKCELIKCDELLSSKSVQTYIRAIKAWTAWMEEEGYLAAVSSSVKLPKSSRVVIEILTEEEIKKIYKYLATKANNRIRDMLIFLLFVECGIRLEEANTLKKSNVRLNQNLLKVLGKGNKERFVGFGVSMNKLIFKYLNQERPTPAKAKIDSLFLKQEGTPITKDTIKQLFRRIKEKTGITKLHPHLCRHTYCTMYLARGGDIFSLKESTGHESFEILNNYVHLASSIVNIQNKSLSLVDEMKMKIE